MPAKKTAKKKLNFEQSIEELEAIVTSMEEDQLSLEELIENYERGAILHKNCESFLTSAKTRLEKIHQTPTTEPTSKNQSPSDDDEIRLF